MADQVGDPGEPELVPEDGILHIRNDDMEDEFLEDGSGTELEEENDFRHGTIHVWDEDSDEDEPRSRPGIIPFYHNRGTSSPQESKIQPAQWWRTLLIGSATPGSLSKGHVAMNLFSSSLHPGVLLAMPVYFYRAGVVSGMVVLTLVSLLGAFGGGLWVSLGRYVGGNTIEAITAKAFGMNTTWKRNIGYGLSSLALVIYCTGAAVIAYHGTLELLTIAMTDLLLQVFFHYSLPGQIFHDRAFVTLAVGGLLTLPLLLSTTPKRNMIQIQSWTVILFYPAIVIIMMIRIGEWNLHSLWRPGQFFDSSASLAMVPSLKLRDYAWPWASTAMLPLFTLSASPPQILAHNRSLRRKNVYESNVTSFLLAQMIQIVMLLLVTYMVAIQVGVVGASKMLGGLHANFFSSLPLDDDYVNACRILFSILLASHLTVCLASARSCWTHLLNVFNVHPLKSVQPPTPRAMRRTTPNRRKRSSSTFPSPAWLPSASRSIDPIPELPEVIAWKRFKVLRSTLAGFTLWTITALTAFFSGVGGVFMREEKEGEELRFLRSLETIGLVGAFVGFILPALIWLVLFRIRRPRAILMLQTNAMRRRINQYLLSPLSNLIGKTTYPEEEPLLAQQRHQSNAEAGSSRNIQSASVTMPNHLNEHTSSNCDDATLILLARKERDLQRKTRFRRRFQKLLVVLALLPFGLLLVIMALIELLEGGF